MLRAFGKKARRILREELITGNSKLQQLDAHRSVARGSGWVPVREAHTNSLYIHHTIGGLGRDSVAVTVGLMHALERLQPGVGYFRPIDHTTIGGHR